MQGRKGRIGKFLIRISILLIIFACKDYIYDFYVDNFVINKDVKITNKNEYYLDYNYKYIKNVDTVVLENKQDLLNLYFTVINSGVDEFDFYCPREYEECINDVKEIANYPDYLSDINGFVHPFNSFDTIETTYDSLNRVKLRIIKTYTDVEIKEIKEKVDEIIKEVVKDETDPEKKIKLVHDYIIDHTKYDKERSDKNKIGYASNTAYGVLFEGYGICGGYADTMGIFLDAFGIPNYRVASSNHIWNAVYLNGKWVHLDLTWDDPILSNGKDVVLHDYFLVSTEKLLSLDSTQHNFNKKIYMELDDGNKKD